MPVVAASELLPSGRGPAAWLRSFHLLPYDRDWAAQPTPESFTVWLTDDERAVLERAIELVRRVRGKDWPTWACFNDLIDALFAEYLGPHYRKVERAYPIFARDGWCCQVPGCGARTKLHAHHVRPRRHGRDDRAQNLTSLCAFHHKVLHDGIIRCRGKAPHRLYWELGREPGGDRGPIARFQGNLRILGGK